MNILFTPHAWEDYLYWQQADKKMLRRINELIRAIVRNPDNPGDGIGKPEALRLNLSGYWSRRINQEHRLVYKTDGDKLIIIACRYHYGE